MKPPGGNDTLPRMRLHTTILICLLSGALAPLAAQDLTITNARIVVANGTVIERGSIVVRGGKIVSVAQPCGMLARSSLGVRRLSTQAGDCARDQFSLVRPLHVGWRHP